MQSVYDFLMFIFFHYVCSTTTENNDILLYCNYDLDLANLSKKLNSIYSCLQKYYKPFRDLCTTMVIKFYHFDASPPSRAVKMTAKALNVPVEVVVVDLPSKEQNKEEFLKLNPTHTVPTIEDNGFVVWDSHAIAQYLSDKYGKSDRWYPKKFEDRTLVNQMLFFETSVLFPSLTNAVRPIYYGNESYVTQEKLDAIETSFQYLETFLTSKKYLASDKNLTIADISAVATVSTIEIFHAIDNSKYPGIARWLEEIKRQEFYKENLVGIEHFRVMFTELLKEKQ